MLRVDLHIHTSASPDSAAEPERVLAESRRLGLDVIAVTDHDTIAGAVHAQRLAPGRVVVGEEITTSEGELIGLFLEREVPAGLTAGDTVERIREQGGVVYLQHPFDRRRRALSEAAVERIADSIDVVEVYNPRSAEDANVRARDLQGTLAVPAAAASDAHRLDEIASAFVEMPAFSDAASFRRSMLLARLVERPARTLLRLRGMARGAW